jgi:hypothetical protein
MLKLLAADVADLQIDLLEKAVAHWAKTSAFMPKAADLRHIAKNIAERESEGKKRLDQAARGNERIERERPGFGFRWIQTETECKLIPIDELHKVDGVWRFRPPPLRPTAEQIDDIMDEFKIPSSSTLGMIAGKVRPPLRNPTASDIEQLKRDMGIPPQAEAAE